MNIIELMNQFKDPLLIEQLSLGEKITASIFVTALGMLITFSALVVLWALTSFYSRLVKNAEAKKKKELMSIHQAQTIRKDRIEEVDDTEDTNDTEDADDTEAVVAAIAVAISEMMGQTQSQVRITSIIRVHDNTPVWGRLGRTAQMNSRM